MGMAVTVMITGSTCTLLYWLHNAVLSCYVAEQSKTPGFSQGRRID